MVLATPKSLKRPSRMSMPRSRPTAPMPTTSERYRSATPMLTGRTRMREPGMYMENRNLASASLATGAQNVSVNSNILESSNNQVGILSGILSESRKQTSILQEGLNYDPSDTFKSDEVTRLRDEAISRGHFESLAQTIEETQRESQDVITGKLDELGEDLSDSIRMAALSSGGGGGGIGEEIAEEAIDAIGGKGKAKKVPKGKGGFLRRVARGGKRVMGKGARLAGKALNYIPGVGLVGAKLGGLATSVGGAATTAGSAIGSTLTGGAGAALTGGAASAATAGAALLSAGAVGYGAGTLINKGVSALTGREDWLTGWFTDKREEKELQEQRKEAYKRFRKTHSEEVLKLAGGEDDFEPRKLIELRKQGLLVKRGRYWYTKAEAEEQSQKDMATMVQEQDSKMKPAGADTSTKDREKLKELAEKKETLLGSYDVGVLKGLATDKRDAERLRNLLEDYQRTKKEYSEASFGKKEVLGEELKQIEAVMKDLSGLDYVALNEKYRQEALRAISEEMAKIAPQAAKETQSKELSQGEAVALVESKRAEVIGALKKERIEALEKEIEEAEERKKEAVSWGETRSINKEIKTLEGKKAKILDLTAKEYKDWLDMALDEAKSRLEGLEKRKGSFWVSPYQLKQETYETEQEVKVYEAEQRRIDTITKRAALGRPTAAPAPVPTALVETTKKEEKAKAVETTQIMERKEKPSSPTVVNVNQAAPERPTPSVRSTRIDDAGVEMIRSKML